MHGRTALVTGASSGLGLHFAQVLARAGATVALAARRTDRLDAACRQIEAQGGQAIAVRMDVSSAVSVRDAMSDAIGRLGRLDILVNNAGTTLTRPLLEITEAEWDNLVNTNLKGCFLAAQEAARIMVQQRQGGAIVNVASILGLRVAAQLAPYVASKAALIRLSQAMALELARHGIRVNALCPGYMETDLNREFFASPAGEALVKRIPQRRLGQLAELDGPLLLLCSEAGSYMTGSVIAVDGGHLVNTL